MGLPMIPKPIKPMRSILVSILWMPDISPDLLPALRGVGTSSATGLVQHSFKVADELVAVKKKKVSANDAVPAVSRGHRILRGLVKQNARLRFILFDK
jgi:hypothetical protein